MYASFGHEELAIVWPIGKLTLAPSTSSTSGVESLDRRALFMRRIAILVAAAIAFLFADPAEAAALKELVARGFRVLWRSDDEVTYLLTRRGHDLYVYREQNELLSPLSEETLEAIRRAQALQGMEPPPMVEQSGGAAKRMTQSETTIDDPLRAALTTRLRASEARLSSLEAEILSLVPNAQIDRELTKLTIHARDPNEFMNIVDRLSDRTRRSSQVKSALKECSWGGCLTSDEVSVSASCGPRTASKSRRPVRLISRSRRKA